jgi:hypothetical protein
VSARGTFLSASAAVAGAVQLSLTSNFHISLSGFAAEKSRYFRNVRAQRGRYGASSHDHDRIDGRDDAVFLGDDLNRVVSVLPASIIDILPHDNSVFYSPPDVQTRPSANNGIG